MSKKVQKVFKNRIGWYMRELDINNADVLRKVNISRNTLERLRNEGETRRIDADVTFELAQFFGVPFERLFYIDDPNTTD